jgi:transcriptional regulator GlxA family with amidase domain
MRTVVIVLFDGVQSLDVTGPLEVFAGANRWQSGRDHSPAGSNGPDGPAYRIRTASLSGCPVRTSSGLRLAPDGSLGQDESGQDESGQDESGQDEGGPDVLLVPGGEGTRDADPDLLAWLSAHGPRARRLVSVCTGAFLLAEAALLDRRRVTTHWAYCATLAARFPEITVDPDPIFVTDGHVTTSAGVTAGIDLALALVEDDLGRDAYQVFSSLRGAQVVFAAEQAGRVSDDERSLHLSAEAALADVPHPDILVVPGGPGQHDQMDDGPLHAWLRAADQGTTWTTSVCTGSLILAGAGLLTGRRATSHWLALGELGQHGAVPVSERVVFDGKYVTAAGVSAGIDMGLTLAGRIAGDEAAQAIQLGIEYDPQPPTTRAPRIALPPVSSPRCAPAAGSSSPAAHKLR